MADALGSLTFGCLCPTLHTMSASGGAIMRGLGTAVLIVALASTSACGYEEHRADHAGAGVESDADGGGHSELKALLSTWFDERTREIITHCECLDESGANPTTAQSDCSYTPSETETRFLECFSNVFADHDSPELREKSRCMIEQLQLRNACLDENECGSLAWGQCSAIQVSCATFDRAFTAIVAEQCPGTVPQM